MTEPARPIGRATLPGATADRLRRAVPAPGQVLAGTLLWSIAMAAGAALNLALDHWATLAKIRIVVALFAVGGALAFAPGLFAARLLSLGRGPEAAFAATFVCLLAATIGVTGCLFGLQYRLYYADWHEPLTTRLGLLEFAGTLATGGYQFLVLGVRLYFPFGFAILLLFSLWFARQAR